MKSKSVFVTTGDYGGVRNQSAIKRLQGRHQLTWLTIEEMLHYSISWGGFLVTNWEYQLPC